MVSFGLTALSAIVMTACSTVESTVGKKITQQRMDTDPSYQWEINGPITRWDEAIPLGNGLTGCLVWGKKNKLRFSLDRGDLWDNRKPKEILEAGFTYENIKKLVKENNKNEISRLSDTPYRSPYPTKLPGVRLSVELDSKFIADKFQLDMGKALASVEFKHGKSVKVFSSSASPVTLIRCPGDVKFLFKKRGGADSGVGQSRASVSKLGYADPIKGTDGDNIWWKQITPQGLEYGVYVARRKVGSETILAVSFTSTNDTADYIALAKSLTNAALDNGFDNELAEHKEWWLDFWGKSDINLPDLKHERYYRLMQYYYGSASRKGSPPMPLQGVWTADTAGLPPWKGDYHHDMNTQMIYWAYYASGRFNSGESLLDFQIDLAPVHRKFAEDFFGVKGLLVPGVMGFDGQPLGGWAQYSLSPTMSVWLLQNFHWHWRHKMDKQQLKDRIYPYCREMAVAMQAILKEDKNGKLKLPLSSSPEIHNNSMKAWLTPNTNNDLALLHWMCDALGEMASALELTEDVVRWKEMRTKLEPLAIDEDNVLRLSPDESLNESHRHHAHLMAIHPLATLNIEQGEQQKKIVLASLDNLAKLKFKAWVGFSFPWASCLEARANRPEKALEYLDMFVDSFTSVNGFNLNGQQREGKGWVSGHRYRPFTLDANFGASQAIHEMLLQSWGDTVRIFPCVPKEWKDVSFEKLRAEGGFVISAEMKGGKTTKVEITATVDATLRLRNNFAENMTWNRDVKVDGNDLVVELQPGQSLFGSLN